MLLLDTCMHTLYIFIQSELSLCIWQVLDHLCVIMCATCVFCFLVKMKIFIILDVTRIAFTGNTLCVEFLLIHVHNSTDIIVNCVRVQSDNF